MSHLDSERRRRRPKSILKRRPQDAAQRSGPTTGSQWSETSGAREEEDDDDDGDDNNRRTGDLSDGHQRHEANRAPTSRLNSLASIKNGPPTPAIGADSSGGSGATAAPTRRRSIVRFSEQVERQMYEQHPASKEARRTAQPATN